MRFLTGLYHYVPLIIPCTFSSTNRLMSSTLSSGSNSILGNISNCMRISMPIRVVAKTLTGYRIISLIRYTL